MAGSGYESIGILFHSLDVYSWIPHVAFLFYQRFFHYDALEKNWHSQLIASPKHTDYFAIYNLWSSDLSPA